MSALNQSKPVIPAWLIWIQCIAFVVLYAVWILPEIVGFRNTALVVGALAGLYPIYQYRAALWTKRAIPIWLIVALFAWATFHLLFLSHDYAAQFLEFKRIWKYAAIGAIFAFGLGLSLNNVSNLTGLNGEKNQNTFFWRIIFLGFCTPVLIYLLKYFLMAYGVAWGILVPAYFKISVVTQPYYIPKTDYVAFCLPTMAVALGQINARLSSNAKLKMREYLILILFLTLITATLFLFHKQDIKNGMAYAGLCIFIFAGTVLFGNGGGRFWRKLFFVLIGLGCLMTALYPHVQKNHSWTTLIADTKIALQTDQYHHWKYVGAQGYPTRETGGMVSVTNYERAAWLKVGLQLAAQTPLGYGLIEDSFKRMVKARWPESSNNLSHSHSGWLDLFLAVGFPGLLCLFGALFYSIVQSRDLLQPWRSFVRWGLFANAALWCTTEVSATVTFACLMFWASLSAGLTLLESYEIGGKKQILSP